MSDIELMTTRHFDDVIQEIKNNSCFDWTKVNVRNLIKKQIKQSDTYQVSGPALILGTGKDGRFYITANGWRFDNKLIGDEVPFIFALNGFEVKGDYQVASLYYILI